MPRTRWEFACSAEGVGADYRVPQRARLFSTLLPLIVRDLHVLDYKVVDVLDVLRQVHEVAAHEFSSLYFMKSKSKSSSLFFMRSMSSSSRSSPGFRD